MKKIISLFVAFVLVLSAFALSACDLVDTFVADENDISGTTVSKETTDTSGDNSQPADVPVKVDSVNGMNAKQLLEAYMAIFEDMKDIDMSGTIVETKDGETVNTTMSMKLGTDAMYVYMNEDGDVTEMTVIDGVLYYNDDGTKIKRTNVSIDEFINEVLSDATGEIADEKVDNAVIYSFGGEYYVDIQLSGEESESFGYEKKEHKLRCYFDAEGKIKRDIVTRDGYTETTVYNSIGKPITVSAPADASSYTTAGSAGGGAVGSSDTYKKYAEVFDKVDKAQVYVMNVLADDELLMEYALDYAGDQAVLTVSEGNCYYMWEIENQGYIARNDGTPEKTTYTSEMEDLFVNARNVKSSFKDMMISETDMRDLSMRYDSSEMAYVIEFYYDYSNGDVNRYILMFNEDITAVDFEIIATYSDGDVESVCYCFYELDNPYYDVYV